MTAAPWSHTDEAPLMRLSPLQLQHSHFVGISLVAAGQPTEPNDSPYPHIDAEDIKVEISLGEIADEPSRGEYILTIGVSNGESKPGFPYRFAAQVEGFFELLSDEAQDDRKKLAVINGGSMLYGIIREQLLSLSTRHRNGPLLLPTLDFRALKELSKDGSEAHQPDGQEKPKRKRKKTA